MENKLTEKQLNILSKAKEIFGDDLFEKKKEEIINKIKLTYDTEVIDYTGEMVKELINDIIYDSNLFKRCIVPPFSVLDTKQGAWKDRRELLDEYLGYSVVGREENLTFSKSLKYGEKDKGTSEFNSVLVEIIYKWFGFPGCNVYDPFAGGHIRGTMAGLLGYKYFGIELAPDQINANIERNKVLKIPNIEWVNDDSLNVDKYIQDDIVDLIFSCPPYGDLEHYTDDPRDLSNMNYSKFIETYEEIIKRSCRKLRNNRFAIFVVGDFRDKDGFYRGFVKDTIIAFRKADLKLYNELILLNNITSASLRANKAFINRKMIKIHQNVLVFFKGDNSVIRNIYREIDSKLPIPTPKQKNLL